MGYLLTSTNFNFQLALTLLLVAYHIVELGCTAACVVNILPRVADLGVARRSRLDLNQKHRGSTGYL